jgi:hypothetical protein
MNCLLSKSSFLGQSFHFDSCQLCFFRLLLGSELCLSCFFFLSLSLNLGSFCLRPFVFCIEFKHSDRFFTLLIFSSQPQRLLSLLSFSFLLFEGQFSHFCQSLCFCSSLSFHFCFILFLLSLHYSQFFLLFGFHQLLF